MTAITFSLQTQQPLLATSFQGDPNSDVSYSYIPGSMIRGAVIGRFMRENNLSELYLTNSKVKRLFFDASCTRYLNAYLQSYEGTRTLPIPRSWFKEKGSEFNDESPTIRVYDCSIEEETKFDTPKPFNEGFWQTEDNSINYYKEKRRINIHNQRDRKKGRSTQMKRNPQSNEFEGEGEIFRYEAIDSGQTFQTVIICSSDDAQFLIDLLKKSSDIWLGGSQSAGYGHTKISNIKYCNDWNEVNTPPKERADREIVTITLISDLILRDHCGQYAVIPSAQDEIPVPLMEEIKRILGINIQLQPKRSFTSSTLIGGFNRKWGLPLPQVPALAAGSVFIFENFTFTLEQIQQLEAQGIGERRSEGFGRVAVNLLDDDSFEVSLPNKDVTFICPKLKTSTSFTLAAQMAESILYQKIEQALQNVVGRKSIKGDISNSQLSRLQLLASQALSTGECNLILSMLNNLPSNAKNQYEKAKIYPSDSNNSFKQQLEEWLVNPSSWSWVSNRRDLIATVANIERKIDDEFARENKLAEKYTLRLIMALAKKATKEKNK